MTEKIYTTKKLGMPMLLVIILGLIAATGMILFGFIGEVSGALGALGILLWIILPICIGGLKVLKPQEALVLTLFGKYKGTLKGEGFYFVNPFCTAINPAQFTQLGQSGDIAGSGGLLGALTQAEGQRRAGQPGRDRRRRHVARGRHREGRLRRRQLQRVPVPPGRHRGPKRREGLPL